MRKREIVVGGLVGALGIAVFAGRQIARALPLVAELVANDGGSTNKKDDKKDMKKKGSGPRTERKKAKKGKA